MYDILRHTFPPPPRFKSPSAPWPDPACASQRPQNSTGDFAQVLCDPGRLTPPMGVKTSVYTPYCLVSYPMRIMPWVSLTLSKKCQALSEKAIQTRRKNRGLLCVRRHQFLQHAVESLPITIIRYCRNSRLHSHCFTCERPFFRLETDVCRGAAVRRRSSRVRSFMGPTSVKIGFSASRENANRIRTFR